MKWDDLIYIADFHELSGDKAIALLGGEPTLHPEFVDYTLYLLERGFHVNVFTSGILSEQRFDECYRNLAHVPSERLSFVCNVNDPQLSPPGETLKVRQFLQAFGHLTVPGFNIYHLDFNLDFIFEYISLYGMKRNLRLGLAHPIPDTNNQHIPIEKMSVFAERLITYLPAFERLQIKAGFDCGFPMCLFTDEQLGRLFKANGGHLRFTCGPAVDIGADLEVWACFPLSNYHRKSLFDFNNLGEVARFFEEKHQLVRSEVGGIFEACDECIYRRDRLCSGGCLAHLLSKFKKEPAIRLKEIYDE